MRPNILLLLTDQHAPRVAGYAGDSVVQTQHLDALAARSVRFDTAVCTSPVCTPSRMCLLTGKDVHRCAAWNNHWMIFPEHKTWPEHFGDHGYRTCLVGKMHFGGRDQMQGFQVRPYGDLRHGLGHQPDPIHLFPGYPHAQSAGVTDIPESLLQDVVVTRETLAFVREHADAEPETPWFVCAGYSRPHSPLTAPGRYIRRYRDRVGPPAAAAHPLEPFAARRYEEVSEEEAVRGREAYYACVDFVDDCMGELLDGLAADGLLENTIVIYTSDHGEMAGEHGLWGKVVYYEPSVGVPLLVSGPGIADGAHQVADPISLMDLYPTTCALAGLPIPEGLDGVDFSEVLRDPAGAAAPRATAPSAYYAYGVRIQFAAAGDDESCAAMRILRSRDWKYIEIEGGQPLLFDMVNDPHEQHNLADRPEHAERCRRMRAELFADFSWDQVHAQLEADRERVPDQLSGHQPSTPNQYMLADGRVFDAEADLYKARWLPIPPGCTSIIPQQFG
jgi:choline-sulfatase